MPTNIKLRRGLRLEDALALANFGLAYNGEAWEHMTPIPCRRGSKRKIPAGSVSIVNEPSTAGFSWVQLGSSTNDTLHAGILRLLPLRQGIGVMCSQASPL